jgi:hypothetical protein
LLTYLIHNLIGSWGNVVEIGGGYGNFLRLADGLATFDRWDIIDLFYIGDLQEWFLNRSHILTTSTYFIPSDDIEDQNNLNPTLVLGIHSLSEFSMEDFTGYFERIISKAPWFFYVTQVSNPSQELLREKIDMVLLQFSLVDYFAYEGGASVAFLLKNKSIA